MPPPPDSSSMKLTIREIWFSFAAPTNVRSPSQAISRYDSPDIYSMDLFTNILLHNHSKFVIKRIGKFIVIKGNSVIFSIKLHKISVI